MDNKNNRMVNMKFLIKILNISAIILILVFTSLAQTYWDKFMPSVGANQKSEKFYFEKEEKKANSKDNKWIRIETKNKDFSAVFPSNSLINKEKTKYFNTTVYGYKDGVTMKFRVYGKRFNKSTLKKAQIPNLSNTKDYKVGKFLIRQIASIPGTKKTSQTFLIASKKNYYSITAKANSENNLTMIRFLMSLKIEGNPLFKNDKIPPFEAETFFIKDLKTSSEISKALNRKSSKMDGKIFYNLTLNDVDKVIEQEDGIRPAIIISQPRLNFSRVNMQNLNGYIEILAKAKILASGQIGDVTFLKAPSKDFAKKCCSKDLGNLKFIPAMKDGKYIDSAVILDYSFHMSTQIQYRIITR